MNKEVNSDSVSILASRIEYHLMDTRCGSMIGAFGLYSDDAVKAALQRIKTPHVYIDIGVSYNIREDIFVRLAAAFDRKLTNYPCVREDIKSRIIRGVQNLSTHSRDYRDPMNFGQLVTELRRDEIFKELLIAIKELEHANNNEKVLISIEVDWNGLDYRFLQTLYNLINENKDVVFIVNVLLPIETQILMLSRKYEECGENIINKYFSYSDIINCDPDIE